MCPLIEPNIIITMTFDTTESYACVHFLDILNPISCPTFTYIKMGIKTVEGRKCSSKYLAYAIGDIIMFSCNGETLSTVIVDIRKYETLEEYLEMEGYDKVLPGIASLEDAHNFYNALTDKEQRTKLREENGYEYMGIEIKLIASSEM